MSLADHTLIQDSCEQKPNEIVRGLTADPVRKTYWVFTDQSIFELGVTNEHRDVWKTYLEQGKYDIALQYAEVYHLDIFFLDRLVIMSRAPVTEIG